jgi:hypothetical protein
MFVWVQRAAELSFSSALFVIARTRPAGVRRLRRAAADQKGACAD